MEPRELSDRLRRLAAAIESAERPSRAKVVDLLRRTVAAVAADEPERFYGPPVPADSNFRLDWALEMLAAYEELRNAERDRRHRKVLDRQVETWRREVERLSGVAL